MTNRLNFPQEPSLRTVAENHRARYREDSSKAVAPMPSKEKESLRTVHPGPDPKIPTRSRSSTRLSRKHHRQLQLVTVEDRTRVSPLSRMDHMRRSTEWKGTTVMDEMAGSHRIRAALYLDFDNVFGGLMDLDQEAAMAFAQSPQEWLERLSSTGLPTNTYRDFLIRRCYLNPSGSKACDRHGVTNERVYFSRFRPFLTRAGFEVLDCPPLTSQSKNASDIRIALDIIEALQHPTPFDEFILFSGDADFTPVLQRIREHDRRTVVVSSSLTAKAYESTADVFLDEQELIELVAPEEPALVSPEGSTESQPSEQAAQDRPDIEALRQRALALTLELVSNSDQPVALVALADAIRAAIGSAVDTTDWFGRRTMSAALSDPRTLHLERSQHHIWDPARHPPPQIAQRDLPDVIRQIATVTGMPRLTREEYRAVFAELAESVATKPFILTRITREARDRLHSSGFEDVGRNLVGFVVRGAMDAGVPFNRQPSPSAKEIAEGFLQSVIQSAASSQMELMDEQRVELTDWLLV
jgi:hypothetical protein